MTGAEVILNAVDGIAWVHLDRPQKRNALSTRMVDDITGRLHGWAGDDSIHALVIAGVPGIFSAGGDLTQVKHPDTTVQSGYRDRFALLETAIRRFPVPTLAVIDGLCIGGGCSIALCCDVRIASRRASFSIPTLRHDRVYERETIARLTDLMGRGRASYLLLSGRTIDAVRAYQFGLVDVLGDDLDAEVGPMLDQLRTAGARTVRATLASLRSVGGDATAQPDEPAVSR